jgi:hypothetical protein
VYFYDDFSSGNLNKWDIDIGSCQSIGEVLNGVLKSTYSDFGPLTIFAKIGYTGLLDNYQVITDLEKDGKMALTEGAVGKLEADLTLISHQVAHYW